MDVTKRNLVKSIPLCLLPLSGCSATSETPTIDLQLVNGLKSPTTVHIVAKHDDSAVYDETFDLNASEEVTRSNAFERARLDFEITVEDNRTRTYRCRSEHCDDEVIGISVTDTSGVVDFSPSQC